MNIDFGDNFNRIKKFTCSFRKGKTGILVNLSDENEAESYEDFTGPEGEQIRVIKDKNGKAISLRFSGVKTETTSHEPSNERHDCPLCKNRNLMWDLRSNCFLCLTIGCGFYCDELQQDETMPSAGL